ncbi:MAG: FAD-dependent oxidoreductase [Alphaproteobacteria bacterium]
MIKPDEIDASPAKSMTVSVLGAGIMGTLSAYFIQERYPDAHVSLYDPNGFPADNASFMAGGMLAPLSELDHMSEAYLPVGFAAIDLWAELSDKFNHGFEFSNRGSLLITHDSDRHMLERFKTILPVNSNKWSTLDAKSLEKMEPQIQAKIFRQALYMRGEAHLHPQKAMCILQDRIQNKYTQMPDIESLKKQCDWVIDCRGMGAQKDMDLRGVKGEVLLVRNPDFALSRPLRLMHPRYPLYIVPRENHEFLIGATIIESDAHGHVSLRSGMELMSALYSLHPSFGDADIIEMKAGTRPSCSDNLPRIEQRKNVICANGLYRHGFLFSPVMAQAVIGVMSGEPYEFTSLFMKDMNDECHTKRNVA